jgi:FtsP/CotA-like multicopper oxidase with cupredoxin domain
MDSFPTDVTGLPKARPTELVEFGHGDQFDIRIAPVAKQIGGAVVRMLAYNGSVPGPTLRVRQGSELVVNVLNEGDVEATVHWHGLRLENRYDGTADTQRPMPVGGRFTYRLKFPDPGIYWYHPHIREDYGQEMGLYGNIVVVPSEAGYWPPVNREITLTLDDLLLESGTIAPFSRSTPTFTAMGRFGNVLLLNGETGPSFTARRGEVVRFYLTDTANTRVFKMAIPGARIKLVGGDSGRCEREGFVDELLIAPSERIVADVLFEHPGRLTLEHRTPARTYPMATIEVLDEPAQPSLARPFATLRTDDHLATERRNIAPCLSANPDKTLALVAEMDMGTPDLPPGATVEYTCPMHPEVSQGEAGRCSKCGMKLLAREIATSAYACPMHPEVKGSQADRCPKCGMKLVPADLVRASVHEAGHHDHPHAGNGETRPGHGGTEHAHDAAGIEWEDDMLEVNRLTTPANMRWKLIDRATGKEGSAIDWRFRVGDRVKIRLVNEMDSDHPMHHPFHIHGAGRFLILSRNGVVEPNLVWKDTVLIRTGQTVDILLEVTNPGLWMAHCHIAEHHESGMMFRFHADA